MHDQAMHMAAACWLYRRINRININIATTLIMRTQSISMALTNIATLRIAHEKKRNRKERHIKCYM